MKIGIVYATVDGQTLKICTKIKEDLLQNNNDVALYSVDDFNEEITNFDKLIIGSSIVLVR